MLKKKLISNQTALPQVLFIIDHKVQIDEALTIADEIRNQTEPVFWLSRKRIFNSTSQISGHGYEVISIPIIWNDNNVEGRSEHSTNNGYLHEAQDTIKHLLLGRWRNTFFKVKVSFQRILWQKKQVLSAFKQFSPKVIVIGGDTGETATHMISAYAKKHDIKVLTYPCVTSAVSKIRRQSAAWSNPQWRINSESPFLTKLVARLIPEAVDQYKGAPVIRQEPLMIVLQKLMGVYPANEWFVGGGGYAYVAVAGKRDWKRYSDYGVSPDKIVITGRTSFDVLFRSMAQRQPRIDSLRVLYAIPPLAEHNVLPWSEHLNELRSVIFAIKRVSSNFRIILHPAHPQEDYLQLATECRVEVDPGPTEKALANTDIFVSSYSSTIPWSIMCNIPVLHLDYSELNGIQYPFHGLKGVHTVNSSDELASVLERMMNDMSYYEKMVESCRLESDQISVFDGKAGDRLANVVLSLLNNEEPDHFLGKAG